MRHCRCASYNYHWLGCAGRGFVASLARDVIGPPKLSSVASEFFATTALQLNPRTMPYSLVALDTRYLLDQDGCYREDTRKITGPNAAIAEVKMSMPGSDSVEITDLDMFPATRVRLADN